MESIGAAEIMAIQRINKEAVAATKTAPQILPCDQDVTIPMKDVPKDIKGREDTWLPLI